MDASASASPSERAASTSPVLDAVDTAPLDAARALSPRFRWRVRPSRRKPWPCRCRRTTSPCAMCWTATRLAYSRLDATAAQEVWPAVNRSALAGAFDGLASQRLSFERCQVSISGSRPTPTALGSRHGRRRLATPTLEPKHATGPSSSRRPDPMEDRRRARSEQVVGR